MNGISQKRHIVIFINCLPTETGRKYCYGHLAFTIYQGPEEATGAVKPVGRALPWSVVGATRALFETSGSLASETSMAELLLIK